MHDLPLLTTVAAAFAAAWVLGLITHRLGLSPIVGYLLAGIAIGKHTPGFQGDPDIALQLAEIGVILLMFGVGLHFKLKDLLAVKGIAIPGAVGQSLCATLAAMLLFHWLGWSWAAGAMVGLAMAVASTVVLLRVLLERGVLSTPGGHAAVGWLIVEDIFTVLALVLVPIIARSTGAEGADTTNAMSGWASLGWALLKLGTLVAIVLLAGSKVVPWILMHVAKLRSRELFTLTVLVLSITIAVGSATIFGASVALGAFLAGMVVAQSPASHQAAADALPMRDAFGVIFFVAVGMLFNPDFVVEQPWVLFAGLAIVLLVKPVVALLIVWALGYPVRTALTVALGLSQIGEFSFILGNLAYEHKLIGESGQHVLVATAIVSITLNPLLFKLLEPTERWLQGMPRVWRILNGRAERDARELNARAETAVKTNDKPRAIIVGHGPVGRLVDALLRDAGFDTVIIEMNIETVRSLAKQGRAAIYGDATRSDVLELAGIRDAVHLVLTLPHAANRSTLVLAARELNPKVEITVRARYLHEREALRNAGADTTIFEEGEAGLALARHVMEKRGVEPATRERLLGAVKKLWGIEAASKPDTPRLPESTPPMDGSSASPRDPSQPTNS